MTIITLTVEIEHTKNTSVETIKECLETVLKETYTNTMEVANVYFPANEALTALKTLLSSYRADFQNITGSELNNTEAVRKAKKVLGEL
jgi:hypothetical protein